LQPIKKKVTSLVLQRKLMHKNLQNSNFIWGLGQCC
jgi:hypothetical protein